MTYHHWFLIIQRTWIKDLAVHIKWPSIFNRLLIKLSLKMSGKCICSSSFFKGTYYFPVSQSLCEVSLAITDLETSNFSTCNQHRFSITYEIIGKAKPIKLIKLLLNCIISKLFPHVLEFLMFTGITARLWHFLFKKKKKTSYLRLIRSRHASDWRKCFCIDVCQTNFSVKY